MLEELRRRLAEMTANRAAAIEALEAITAAAEGEERSLTVDEDESFTAKIGEVKAIDASLDSVRSRIADLEEIERNSALAAKVAPFNVNKNRDPYDLSDLRFGASRSEIHSRVHAILSEDRSDKTAFGLNPEEREGVMALLRRVDTVDGRLGRRIAATSSRSYYDAFAKVQSDNTYALVETERQAIAEMRAATLTDAAGGFAIPFSVDTTIISTDAGSTNPFRQISTVKQTMADVWQGVSSAGVSASFDAEAAEVSDDTPTLASPTITTRMARVFVPFSIEIGMDWANMESDIRSMFQDAKDDLETTVFTTGAAGSNQPIGIVTALTGSASEINSAGEALAAADIYGLDEALPARYRGRASFVANRAIYNDVRQLDSAGGSLLWERIGAGMPGQLLGYNAYENSAMDGSINAAATESNYSLILGDFSYYYIIDRVGMNVELVPHLFATANNLPSGQRGLFGYWRVGADSVNDDAFRMLDIATTA